jgi:hypothetical protein
MLKGVGREPTAPKPPSCLFCDKPVLPTDDAEGSAETGVIAHVSCRRSLIDTAIFNTRRCQIVPLELNPILKLFDPSPAERKVVKNLILDGIWGKGITPMECFLALHEIEVHVVKLQTSDLNALRTIRAIRKKLYEPYSPAR